jgi:hypothetical protein
MSNADPTPCETGVVTKLSPDLARNLAGIDALTDALIVP